MTSTSFPALLDERRSVRYPLSIQRRAMDQLLRCVTAAEQVGVMEVTLKKDPNAKDAIFTLHAMGVTTDEMVSRVGHPCFSEHTVLVVLAACIVSELTLALNSVLYRV